MKVQQLAARSTIALHKEHEGQEVEIPEEVQEASGWSKWPKVQQECHQPSGPRGAGVQEGPRGELEGS